MNINTTNLDETLNIIENPTNSINNINNLNNFNLDNNSLKFKSLNSEIDLNERNYDFEKYENYKNFSFSNNKRNNYESYHNKNEILENSFSENFLSDNDEEDKNDCNSNSNNNTNINYKYHKIKNFTTKNKWDLLKFSDKIKIFNFWYFLFALGNIFQIFSGFINLIFPILGENNMLFNSLSCMLSWFAIGYFLDYDKNFSVFYKILKKKGLSYLKFLFLFFLIFISFVILGISIFSNSYNFSGFSSGCIFFFALIFGDTMLGNYHQISDKRPYLVICIAFLFFLCFNMLCLKIFTTITEDAFDHVKMNNNFSWLDKKITLSEYISNQIKSNENEEEEDNVDNPGFMVSDVFVQYLLLREIEIDEKINEYIIKKDNKLKKDFLTNDDIEFNCILRKKLKKLKKKLLSKNFMNNIIKHDNENDPLQVNLNLGKSDWKNKKLKYYYDIVEMLFKCILNHFDKIDNIFFSGRKIYLDKLTTIEKNKILTKIYIFANSIILRIRKLNLQNKPKLKRTNTSANIIFTLNQ